MPDINYRELNREIRVARETRNAFAERLWMGAFGGAALIGPMLPLVLHRDQNTSIITASVATSPFTLVLGFGARELGGKDILAATAAYAAVLVVFVVAAWLLWFRERSIRINLLWLFLLMFD